MKSELSSAVEMVFQHVAGIKARLYANVDRSSGLKLSERHANFQLICEEMVPLARLAAAINRLSNEDACEVMARLSHDSVVGLVVVPPRELNRSARRLPLEAGDEVG